jgi:conjugative relaxase-like TrwC/TraI family protein
MDAHSGAVQKALAFAEDRYAQARAMAGGKQVVVSTGNIAAALFLHMTSRALDPQLHTHAFVLNITRRPEDGQWRALHRGKQITTGRGTTAILSNPFYRHRLLLGQIYQNELARDLALAGYHIRVTDLEDGLWELAGVPDSLIRAFSKRRAEIERLAKDYQKTHPDTLSLKIYDRATLNTRLWKEHDVTTEELIAMWRATAEHLGTPLETLPGLAMSPTRGTLEEVFPGDSFHTPEEILARATASLRAGTDHVPTQEQILLAALKLGIGSYGIESLDVSRAKTPPTGGHDKTVIDAPARSQIQDGGGDRKLQLEI